MLFSLRYMYRRENLNTLMSLKEVVIVLTARNMMLL